MPQVIRMAVSSQQQVALDNAPTAGEAEALTSGVDDRTP